MTIDEAREKIVNLIESVSVHSFGGWNDAIDDLIAAVREDERQKSVPLTKNSPLTDSSL